MKKAVRKKMCGGREDDSELKIDMEQKKCPRRGNPEKAVKFACMARTEQERLQA